MASSVLKLTGFSSHTSPLGITATKIDNLLSGTLTRIVPLELNNGAVLEIFIYVEKSMSPLFTVMSSVMKDFPTIDERSLQTKVKRLFTKYQEQRKKRSQDLAEFLGTPFSITQKHTSTANAETATLKRQVTEQERCLKEKIQKLNTGIENRETEHAEEMQSVKDAMTDKQESLQSKLHHVREKRSGEIRNVVKKVKRRDETIDDLKKELNEVKKENELQMKESKEVINNLKTEIERLEQYVQTLKAGKRTAQKTCSRLRVSERKKSEKVGKKDQVISDLQKQVEDQQNDLRYCEDLTTLMDKDTLETFQDGKYINELRQTIMILLTQCNVSMSKVNQVIETVISNLTGMSLSGLPSNGVLSKLLVEAKVVASVHVADRMLTEGDPKGMTGHVLHSDATTKHHRHYESFQVTLPSGKTMSIGLKETAGGATEELTEAFLSTIKDLADAIQGCQEEKIAKLIASLKHTMSDQGSVNPTFNLALQKLRSDLLETAIVNWENLTPPSREEIKKMTNFFCKMHIVVNFASEADKILKLFESNVAEGRNPHALGATESGSVRLIRTACKSFTSRGCDKSGVHSMWKSYLDEKGEENKMVTFKGNRFNITFYDGGAVYFHKDHIHDFISSLSDANSLLESVNFDIQEPAYLAGIRALGIIDKVITGPYWRLLETKGGIYDLNTHLHQMKITMEAWSKDASPLLSVGETLFNPDVVQMHQDEIYQKLFEPTSPLIESLTQLALEVLMSSLLIILERQAKDNLPGGKHWSPSEEQKDSASHVPKTNTCSERDFGMLDMIIKNKPAAGVHVLEVVIMWTNNKTAEWLTSLDDMKKNQILDQARKSFPTMKAKLKEREAELKKKQLAKLKERQAKKEATEKKHHINRVQLTNKMTQIGGLWQAEEIPVHLQQLPTEKQQKEALYVQLHFHRDVLRAQGPRQLFQKSCKDKQFSVDELTTHLREVLDLNVTPEQPTINTLTYRSPTQRSVLVDEMKGTLAQKLVDGRQKRNVEQTKLLLPHYKENPKELIGQKIEHKCIEEAGMDPKWYKADICRLHKNHTDPLKMEFIVQYQDQSEYHFPLLKDIQNGDLILIEHID